MSRTTVYTPGELATTARIEARRANHAAQHITWCIEIRNIAGKDYSRLAVSYTAPELQGDVHTIYVAI